jgi:uncharacterized membrane protein
MSADDIKHEEWEQPDTSAPSAESQNNPSGQNSSRSNDQVQDGGQSSVERAAGVAREQANQAAEALRRGEFMHDAALDPAASSDDRLIALLAYITQVIIPVIMPVIVLLSESSKHRPFQRYHAIQSLALILLFFALGASVMVGTLVIQIVPFIGALVALLVACMSPIAYLMAVVALLYYGYQAYQGKRFAIPGLTSFLRDQGWLT